jgi:hypothetical protein
VVTKRSFLMRPRRVGVTGAVPWSNSDMAQCFCEALGVALIKRDATVVTRGGKASAGDKGKRWPVDEYVVTAAAAAAIADGKALDEAIETVIGEVKDGRELFHVGTLAPIKGRTYEAQRFEFLTRVDGVIGICGRRGTEQTLILGLSTERPILPVALFGGAGEQVWKDHKDYLVEILGVKRNEIDRWSTPLASKAAAEKLAEEMVDRLIGSMTRKCFVITPFQKKHSALYDFVIAPAVEGLGDKPIRLDRAGVPGDVGDQIEDGIRRADYVIVVLDGLRPNVLYELGLAHGRDKPTILMNQRESLGTKIESMPFDLALQQRLEYDAVDAALPERLQKAIQAIEFN